MKQEIALKTQTKYSPFITLFILAFLLLITIFGKYKIKNLFNDDYTFWFIIFILIIICTTDWVKYFGKKNQPQKIGLIIDDDGFTTHHTEIQSLEKIYWKDVEFIGLKQPFLASDILVIKLKNPLKYLDRIQANYKAKKVLLKNMALHQTPVIFSANYFELNNRELKKLLTEKWKKNHID